MATEQVPPGTVTYDYYYRRATQIIDESDDGYFYNSARLIDTALRDARLRATLSTRVSGLLGKPLKFDPAKDNARHQKIADEIESLWPQMFAQSTLTQLLEWGIMQGVGLAQIVKDFDPWRVEVWHPRCLTWDPFSGNYYLATKETQRFDLTRNDDGTFSGPDGSSWFLYLPNGYGDIAGKRAAIRAVHQLAGEREWAHRDRSRYMEIFAKTIRLGTAPGNSTQAQREEFRQLIYEAGSGGVVVASEGEEGNRWGLKLVEASGKSTELFHQTLGQLDKEIATLLLGQSQSTDGQAGLGANDQAGEPVRLDIIRGDNDTFSDSVRAQVLVPFCEFAYGAGQMAPWLCWDVEPAEDTQKKALEFKDLVTGLVMGKDAGLPIDDREMLEDYNVPMISKAEQAALDARAAEEKAAQSAQINAIPPVKNGNGAPSRNSIGDQA